MERRKNEKPQRRCQDQEDEEVQLQGREHIYIHTAGVFPEGTMSPEGSTLQQIFPRGLSLMEATCTRAGKKYEEEGMATMKSFGLIANPPFLTPHCLAASRQ